MTPAALFACIDSMTPSQKVALCERLAPYFPPPHILKPEGLPADGALKDMLKRATEHAQFGPVQVMPVPLTYQAHAPQDLMQESELVANDLAALAAADRFQVLTSMQETDPTFHALVKARLDDLKQARLSAKHAEFRLYGPDGVPCLPDGLVQAPGGGAAHAVCAAEGHMMALLPADARDRHRVLNADFDGPPAAPPPLPEVDEETRQKILRGDHGSCAGHPPILGRNLIVTGHKHNADGSETMTLEGKAPEHLPHGPFLKREEMPLTEFFAYESGGEPATYQGPPARRNPGDVQAIIKAAEREPAPAPADANVSQRVTGAEFADRNAVIDLDKATRVGPYELESTEYEGGVALTIPGATLLENVRTTTEKKEGGDVAAGPGAPPQGREVLLTEAAFLRFEEQWEQAQEQGGSAARLCTRIRSPEGVMRGEWNNLLLVELPGWEPGTTCKVLVRPDEITPL